MINFNILTIWKFPSSFVQIFSFPNKDRIMYILPICTLKMERHKEYMYEIIITDIYNYHHKTKLHIHIFTYLKI